MCREQASVYLIYGCGVKILCLYRRSNEAWLLKWNRRTRTTSKKKKEKCVSIYTSFRGRLLHINPYGSRRSETQDPQYTYFSILIVESSCWMWKKIFSLMFTFSHHWLFLSLFLRCACLFDKLLMFRLWWWRRRSCNKIWAPYRTHVFVWEQYW